MKWGGEFFAKLDCVRVFLDGEKFGVGKAESAI
jgi:hypothetical protein